MQWLKKIFTWWDGATIGTLLYSSRNGTEIGRDALGNIYYESKKADSSGRTRRWVIYNGSNDASRVAPEWHGWLHGTIAAPPDQALPPPPPWQKPAIPNLTGTREAYRPAGALEAGGRRAPATGDYEAWKPS